ncbi:MAG: glycerate kinase [Negativicutes bacterium]
MFKIIKIRNYDTIVNNGDSKSREKVLQLMESVLQEVDAEKRIDEIMRLDGDILQIGDRTWDLRAKNRIYLFGAGKACNAMAQAVCNIMGNKITKGIISVKIKEPQDQYFNTDVYVGGHPLPNSEGMVAGEQILKMIEQARSDDLFISVISGGSSALLTYPVEGISLEEEILAQDLLLKSGAKILEINAVRRHISKTNGGRIAELIREKGAELINLMVGDAVGRPPTSNRGTPVEFFGTPVAGDKTTIQDARNTIMNYELKDKLPKTIVDYIFDDNRVRETPKCFDDKVVTFLLGSVGDSCEAAVAAAKKMDIPIMVLSTYLEGESREAGYLFSSIIREIKHLQRPIAPPCFVVCAGETTTSINYPPLGIGGPSQELTLGLAIGINEMEGVAAASIDTEGTDGTTKYAGGLVDGYTIKRLETKNINVIETLRRHSAGNALMAIGDNIYTGNTGTNLCDFNVFYIA